MPGRRAGSRGTASAGRRTGPAPRSWVELPAVAVTACTSAGALAEQDDAAVGQHGLGSGLVRATQVQAQRAQPGAPHQHRTAQPGVVAGGGGRPDTDRLERELADHLRVLGHRRRVRQAPHDLEPGAGQLGPDLARQPAPDVAGRPGLGPHREDADAERRAEQSPPPPPPRRSSRLQQGGDVSRPRPQPPHRPTHRPFDVGRRVGPGASCPDRAPVRDPGRERGW